MDIYLRYQSSEHDQVVTRYLTSSFLGHCTAQDLLKSFKESMAQTDLSKIVQISMDGPNVNHKFYKMYADEPKQDNPDQPVVFTLFMELLKLVLMLQAGKQTIFSGHCGTYSQTLQQDVQITLRSLDLTSFLYNFVQRAGQKMCLLLREQQKSVATSANT